MVHFVKLFFLSRFYSAVTQSYRETCFQKDLCRKETMFSMLLDKNSETRTYQLLFLKWNPSCLLLVHQMHLLVNVSQLHLFDCVCHLGGKNGNKLHSFQHSHNSDMKLSWSHLKLSKPLLKLQLIFSDELCWQIL